jgi:hypothetical protein
MYENERWTRLKLMLHHRSIGPGTGGSAAHRDRLADFSGASVRCGTGIGSELPRHVME